MLLRLTNEKSTLVQVMAWCRKASHYLSQCWARSKSPYGVSRPQWISLHCQCHYYWWPGDTRGQGISIHGIDIIILEYSSFNNRRVKSMTRCQEGAKPLPESMTRCQETWRKFVFEFNWNYDQRKNRLLPKWGTGEWAPWCPCYLCIINWICMLHDTQHWDTLLVTSDLY